MAFITMSSYFSINLKKTRKKDISRRAIATFQESSGEPQHFSSLSGEHGGEEGIWLSSNTRPMASVKFSLRITELPQSLDQACDHVSSH